MHEFTIVSTFNAYRHPWGARLVQSFINFMPADLSLILYLERSERLQRNPELSNRIEVHEYHEAIPEYQQFVNRFSSSSEIAAAPKTYKFDVFRFAFKPFAIRAAARELQTRYLIWMDADVFAFKQIPPEFLHALIPEPNFCSFLGRSHIDPVKYPDFSRYSECGFMIFDLEHPATRQLFNVFLSLYESGEFVHYPEWHDSFLFDRARESVESELKATTFDISSLGLIPIEKQSHVFVASVLGQYLDHTKGVKKSTSHSPEMIERQKIVQQLQVGLQP